MYKHQRSFSQNNAFVGADDRNNRGGASATDSSRAAPGGGGRHGGSGSRTLREHFDSSPPQGAASSERSHDYTNQQRHDGWYDDNYTGVNERREGGYPQLQRYRSSNSYTYQQRDDGSYSQQHGNNTGVNQNLQLPAYSSAPENRPSNSNSMLENIAGAAWDAAKAVVRIVLPASNEPNPDNSQYTGYSLHGQQRVRGSQFDQQTSWANPQPASGIYPYVDNYEGGPGQGQPGGRGHQYGHPRQLPNPRTAGRNDTEVNPFHALDPGQGQPGGRGHQYGQPRQLPNPGTAGRNDTEVNPWHAGDHGQGQPGGKGNGNRSSQGFIGRGKLPGQRQEVGPAISELENDEAGFVQGINWYKRNLEIDEEGDVADEFLFEEVDSEGNPKALTPKAKTKLPIARRVEISVNEGAIQLKYEYKKEIRIVPNLPAIQPNKEHIVSA